MRFRLYVFIWQFSHGEGTRNFRVEAVFEHGNEMRCILILMVAIMASVTTRGAGEEGAVRLCGGDQVVAQTVGNLVEGAHMPHKNYQ